MMHHVDESYVWQSDEQRAAERRDSFKRALLRMPLKDGGEIPCQHATWTLEGLYPRTYLKCSTCPAVMPVCHECGQSLDVDPNGDEW